MKKKIVAVVISILILSIVGGIFIVSAELPAQQCTVENPGGVNVYPDMVEGSVSTWCPLTNTTYTFGCTGASIYKWIYGNAPTDTGAIITDLAGWRSAALIWNDYEKKIYTYGSAQTDFTNKITSYDPTGESTNTVVLAETLTCANEVPSGAFSPIQNSTYIFGGDIGGAGNILTDTISKHTFYNSTVWNLSTAALPVVASHMETSTVYVPDLDIIVVAGGITTGYTTNGGLNTILILNCTNDTLYTSSATVPYTYKYPTSDMVSFYNPYDNLVYFAGGCSQVTASYVYEDAVWVYDPFTDAVENLETTQSVVLSNTADDFGAAYAMNLMMGQFLRVGKTTAEQTTINVLNQTNASVIPQLEAIYQNFTLGELTTYMNYKWNDTVATEYPRYNGSSISVQYPIFEWWYDAGSSGYNLTFADDNAFTTDVVTISNINETNYPTEYDEFGPLVRFKIPTGTDIGNGTRYVKVNGSGESDWWVFEGGGTESGGYESDIQFISINGQVNGTTIVDATPIFNWTNVSTLIGYHILGIQYRLEIANDSAFTDVVVNFSNISSSNSFFSGYYSDNSTRISLTLHENFALETNKIYYCRVTPYYISGWG